MSKTLGVVAAAMLVACGSGGKKDAQSGGEGAAGATDPVVGAPLIVPKIDPELCLTDGKKVAAFDLNGDEKPDVWKLYVEKKNGAATSDVITCKQVDLDHNGKQDFVEQYDESGDVVLQQYDFDFDGHLDARIHYDRKTRKRFLVERDTGHDKKSDLWEEWSYDKDGGGKEWLSRVLRDRNGDERPDYWELYRKQGDDGELEAILYDDDFDGKVERRDDAPPPAKVDDKAAGALPPGAGADAGPVTTDAAGAAEAK